MNSNRIRVALAASLAAAVMVAGCSKKEEPAEPAVVEQKSAPVKAPQRTATPAVVNAVPFPSGFPLPSGPPEALVKESLPPAGPVASDYEASQTGQAAFEHYAQLNGFSEESVKSFVVKQVVNNGDHFRLMMFGSLPGGARYIAVKVYRDGRTEVLPDEM